MTPRQFEAAHAGLWRELEAGLDAIESGQQKLPAARLAQAYRRVCEHLALARARHYPLHLAERLDALAQRAHRLIYRRHGDGWARVRHFALVAFPQCVRAHRRYLLVAALALLVPSLLLTFACWHEPAFALTVLSAQQMREFERMYSGEGRVGLAALRSADTDWTMFGFYILHNVSISFQCFASGLLAGVGSLFYMLFNGVIFGAVAGYLQAIGEGRQFWPFVITHSAFEVTAIVISGAAGLRLGHAMLAPGRLSRVQALRAAAADCALLIYGVAAMLLIAAGLEAYWSSAGWVAPEVKLGVGTLAWAGVALYFTLQGRPRRRTAAVANWSGDGR